jgi:Tfp pilus assembly protein PilX
MRLSRIVSRLHLGRLRGEEGSTVAVAMGAMMVVSVLTAAALGAAKGDLHLTKNDLDHKQAFAAAQAGIQDYAFHLGTDTGYWARCTVVPSPNAVNQMGSTTKRRSVAGSSSETYAIELIPATGQSACSTTSPTTSMLEPSGPMAGSFRIRSTGYSGNTKVSIVATFKRASFLDYVYFTQLETSDPVTYGSSSVIAGANQQCTKTYQQGRMNATIPNSGGLYCDVISFINGEQIRGPLHTNDALAVCGTPIFGRNASDSIEVSSPPQGWYASGTIPHSGSNCTASPSFVGTFFTNSAVLTPPPDNQKLATLAQGDGYKYTGQTTIALSGTNLTITNNGTTVTRPIPPEGVVYIGNSTTQSCSASYSPFNATYPSSSPCGNVFVHGTYTGQVTIAAQNDVIVDGNVCRGSCSSPTGNGMLGLVANNFVRVYHPYSAETSKGDCDGSNGTGSLSNPRIDAAILAISHSFIVDHYDCGNALGTLTVNGAISQKFRGPVGTFSGSTTVTGYSKNYNYDDRLRYLEPPHFLDPVQVAWHIQRETLDFP